MQPEIRWVQELKSSTSLSCNSSKEQLREWVPPCSMKVSVKANPVILFLVPLTSLSLASASSSSSSFLFIFTLLSSVDLGHRYVGFTFLTACTFSSSSLFPHFSFLSIHSSLPFCRKFYSFIATLTTSNVISGPRRVSASSKERKWCVRMFLYLPVIWSDARLR